MPFPKSLSPRRSPADEPCPRVVYDRPGDFFAAMGASLFFFRFLVEESRGKNEVGSFH